MNKTTNQTNQTKGNETQNKLIELQNERNEIITHLLKGLNYYTTTDLQNINAEIMQTLSEVACYKTLKFLMSNNATNGTNTETTENGTINTYGYNMALKLFNDLYNDIRLMHNTEILNEIFSDSADLIQESVKELTPYFNNYIAFNLQDTIYTKTLKNGNVKNYNSFQLACKSIRAYITNQDKKQYKKLGYCIGYTENGKEVITTKKPKNDITDIEQESRKTFIKKYHFLTSAEQTAILNQLNGLTTTEQAEQMQVSKRTIERLLKSAKEKILVNDKRVQL
jgi:predicted DNA-binding protein (UPF0251 family)